MRGAPVGSLVGRMEDRAPNSASGGGNEVTREVRGRPGQVGEGCSLCQVLGDPWLALGMNLGSWNSAPCKHGSPRAPTHTCGRQCLPRGNRPGRQIGSSRSLLEELWSGTLERTRAHTQCFLSACQLWGRDALGSPCCHHHSVTGARVRSSWVRRGLAMLPPRVWLHGRPSVPQAWGREP